MKLVVISPEGFEPREHAILAALFAAGLERYHVRKPGWTAHALKNYLPVVPEQWRSRLVLHQHHELADELGCGGVHFKEVGRVIPNPPEMQRRVKDNAPYLQISRSCHDLAGLDGALGKFDSAFLSPVFPSISKPGYQPTVDLATVAARLARRTDSERQTAVIALGGITPANAGRCAEFGFDGVAVLGALWQAREPLKVFEQLQSRLGRSIRQAQGPELVEGDASLYLNPHHVA